jgi:hypothetical protein
MHAPHDNFGRTPKPRSAAAQRNVLVRVTTSVLTSSNRLVVSYQRGHRARDHGLAPGQLGMAAIPHEGPGPGALR